MNKNWIDYMPWVWLALSVAALLLCWASTRVGFRSGSGRTGGVSTGNPRYHGWHQCVHCANWYLVELTIDPEPPFAYFDTKQRFTCPECLKKIQLN
jgi:hypothetical protein